MGANAENLRQEILWRRSRTGPLCVLRQVLYGLKDVFRRRLTAGQRPLEPLIKVRILASEPGFPHGETVCDVDSRSLESARLTDLAATALGYLEAGQIDLARDARRVRGAERCPAAMPCTPSASWRDQVSTHDAYTR
jgi:hypothetical protein